MERLDNMLTSIKHLLKYKINPKDPEVDCKSKESRINWILYMVNRDGKYPVSEVNKKFEGMVSTVTINKDFQRIEQDGLIKRERDRSTGKSYLILQFKDSGIDVGSKEEQRKEFLLKYGLPLFAIINITILIILSYITK